MGKPNYYNDMLTNKEDIFAKGGGFYLVYKLMYDVFSAPSVTKEDYMTAERFAKL